VNLSLKTPPPTFREGEGNGYRFRNAAVKFRGIRATEKKLEGDSIGAG
jgi:hypothetical protein